MIAGIGIDLVEISRIERIHERFGHKFIAKIFSPCETLCMPANPASWLSGRFAAKEAVVKALGTGFSNGITMQDIEVLPDTLGRPKLRFYNAALTRARELGVRGIHLSITHERCMAAAVVVLEN